jgi:serpin B
LQKYFASDAKSVNLKGNSEAERNNINSWVGETTRGKITDLIPSGAINSLTAMVLVQATYFKGNWRSKFDSANTRPGDFHTPQVKASFIFEQTCGIEKSVNLLNGDIL